MSMPQTYELGWLSYLSNILSPPLAKKWGSKNLSPHFQNRGAASELGDYLLAVAAVVFLSSMWTSFSPLLAENQKKQIKQETK